MATTARHEAPDRNLALELVRVTEAAAMAAGRWVGRGDKNGADGAAVNAMRQLIHTVSMNGVVVIGEGEKDEAPMLFNGEHVGDGTGPECDVAVDPIDGTRLTALGMGNAISVIAVAERGTMFDPSAVFYMEKLATGPEAADVVDIRLPVAENVRRVAKAKGESPVRRHRRHPRPAPARADGRGGARDRRADQVHHRRRRRRRHHGRPRGHRHRPDARHRRHPRGHHRGLRAQVAWAACIQGRLWPKDDDERQKAIDAGHDLDRVLTTDDLVRGDDVFFAATGITDGELLTGRALPRWLACARTRWSCAHAPARSA